MDPEEMAVDPAAVDAQDMAVDSPAVDAAPEPSAEVAAVEEGGRPKRERKPVERIRSSQLRTTQTKEKRKVPEGGAPPKKTPPAKKSKKKVKAADAEPGSESEADTSDLDIPLAARLPGADKTPPKQGGKAAAGKEDTPPKKKAEKVKDV
eukprot:CAMPEP_0180196102 /NCGR_PEP_ID=MMETSP0987-20121128/3937_1 /TAXON_ID=697907 /ORGANISM="non described non described, Strain CCMP2293" /LENGTH=149 /DNA_ID=CAMNT_0022150979 /DNA_START=64 /DNA_END=509 /DNA_ORIENTATION=+